MERSNADIFVTLDLPPRLTDRAAARRRKILVSVENFRTLCDRFPSKTIMPVIHGRCIREIELSVNRIAQTSMNLEWVGLGGVVPLLQNRRARGLDMPPELFIARALAIARSAFPKSKIHVFGAGGTRTFPAVFALGADSGDSIGWRQAAGYGSIFLPMKSQRVVKWNREKGPPRRLLDESDLIQIEKCGCPICRGKSVRQRLAAFQRHFYDRSIHNAWTIMHQSRFWPRSRHALSHAVSNGALGSSWAKAINQLSMS